MYRLSNSVRTYDWGSTAAIPELLGIASDGGPKAELWMGAHPDAPSLLPDGSRLDERIIADAQRLLGASVAKSFGTRLPYLLKVLSAAAPMSLQVHPDAEQAAAGFADEESRRVPLAASNRRYRDPFHKPEMVVALEPFDALCGLRHPAETLALLGVLDVEHPGWPHLRELLSAPDERTALRDTVSWLLGGDDRLPSLVRMVGRAAAVRPDRPELATAAALAAAYPGDPGVIVALLLNRVTLAPGEALFLPPGNLHAYLHGTAIEIMASSDNVLRAGLTAKFVDPAELMRITDFTPRPLPVVLPERHGPVSTYRPGAAEFELACVDLPAVRDQGWHELDIAGPRILLVLRGELDVTFTQSTSYRDGVRAERAGRGTSLFVSAAAGALSLRGDGTAVVAGVPTHPGGSS